MKKIYLVLLCAASLWAALDGKEWDDLYMKCSTNKDQKACKTLISNGVPNLLVCDKSDCSKIGRIYYVLNAVQKASGFYKKACELGDVDGCWFLGDMYAENQGFDKNTTMAIRYWDKGCGLYGKDSSRELESALVCLRLAQGHYKGNKKYGIKKDFAKAKTYYERLCGFDDGIFRLDACVVLGTMYYEGKGTKKDFFKAFELFETFCGEDSGEACLNLANMYDKGEGIRQNLILAKKYYGKACDLKVQKGCASYKRLNEKGIEDIKEDAKDTEEKGFLDSVKGLWDSLF